MSVRVRPTTEQLLSDRIVSLEHLLWDRHIVLASEPTVAITVEESFTGNVRVVLATCVPYTAVEENGIAGFTTDRGLHFPALIHPLDDRVYPINGFRE